MHCDAGSGHRHHYCCLQHLLRSPCSATQPLFSYAVLVQPLPLASWPTAANDDLPPIPLSPSIFHTVGTPSFRSSFYIRVATRSLSCPPCAPSQPGSILIFLWPMSARSRKWFAVLSRLNGFNVILLKAFGGLALLLATTGIQQQAGKTTETT